MGMTIKDIAKKCGVGVSTVSRALNNHPDINPETKKMILKTVEESNFVPNNSARNLKRTDSKSIAILVKEIDNPFFDDAGNGKKDPQTEIFLFYPAYGKGSG